MSKNVVIVGGGIAGLISAYFIALRSPDKDVILVEKNARLGGLHRTFTYDSGVQFDCGMHFWTETGLDDLDSHMRSLLPDKEWIYLTGVDRDRSGLFLNGRVQSHSQYPDLRKAPDNEYARFVADFFRNLNTEPGTSSEPAEHESFYEFAVSQFGASIAHAVINPIAEKVHGHRAADLHPMAKSLPLLDRVVLFDEPLQLNLMQSDILRARLAFPDQRRLPLTYSSGLSSLYPKKYGIYRVVEAIRKRLTDLGVQILTSSFVKTLKIETGRVVEATVNTRGADQDIDDIDQIVWANLCVSLAPLLGLDLSQFDTDPVRKTVLVNALCQSPPNMNQLYCLFNGDPAHKSYRITDYSAYCPSAVQNGCFPVSVEMLLEPGAARDKAELQSLALAELQDMGVTSDGDEPVFSAVEILSSGFPSVTRKNIQVIESVRDMMKTLHIENIELVGILGKPNLFFQKDVLVDVYHQFARAEVN